MKAVFGDVEQKFGKINVLVNNAGITGVTSRPMRSPKKSGTN